MRTPASKRPFRYPVPAEAIEAFSHPRAGHHYHAPAWGRDAMLYASTGWVAVRFHDFPSTFGTGPQTMVERLRRNPWHSGRHEDPKAWRKLDDVTLDLFQEGVFEPWDESLRRYRIDPNVRINHGAVVPLVSLQLVSRLPRAEIYTTPARGCPLPFRFNGGEGLLAQLTREQQDEVEPEMCHLFAAREQRI